MALKTICEQYNIGFDSQNKIYISDTVKHIKIDIGLSYNAPQSQSWLSHESDLIIFGFEPNPMSVAAICSPTNEKRNPNHGDVLEYKYLNKDFFIIPVALSDVSNSTAPFYVTSGDAGCSSLMKPNLNQLPSFIGLESVIQVPVFTLSDFFDIFPFDKFPIIEYIKVDAQGSDLKIIKGGRDYIKEHVVFITLEPETSQYDGAENNNQYEIISYMSSIGFQYINHPNTIDPTFVNTKFIDIASNIFIKQSM